MTKEMLSLDPYNCPFRLSYDDITPSLSYRRFIMDDTYMIISTAGDNNPFTHGLSQKPISLMKEWHKKNLYSL